MKTLLILIAILWAAPPVYGEESNQDWMTYYYRNPSPERFVEETHKFVEAKLFERQNAQIPLAIFLSQVMSQNPTKVEGWLKEFEYLDENQQETLLLAAWYSGTESAQDYFKQHELEEYLNQKVPKILEMEVDNPDALDGLWGYFMATGDSQPIRRIVTALSLSKYSGALEHFKTSEKTEQDKKEAYWGVTFRAARWSLESNCRQHPIVLQYCETILKEEELPKGQKLWLGKILAKVIAANEQSR